MIKIFLVILSFILPVLSFAQNMHTCRGSLIDSSGQAVTDAMVVLMTKSDSVQLKLDYSRTGRWVSAIILTISGIYFGKMKQEMT